MEKPPVWYPSILDDMIDLFIEVIHPEIEYENYGECIGSFVEYMKDCDLLNKIDISRVITECVHYVYEEESDVQLRYYIIEAFLNAIRIGELPLFLYPESFANDIKILIEDFNLSRGGY